MSAWKIHLVWGVLTVVIAAAWGQHVASRKEREFEAERTAARLNRRSPAPVAVPTSEPAPLPVSSAAPSDPSLSPDPEAASSRKKDPQKGEILSPEEIRALLQSGDKGDIQRALRGIEQIQDRALRLALLKECLAHADKAVREKALDQLRKEGGPEAAEMMAKALLTDPDEGIRRRAARYLGDVGGPAAMSALQQASRTGTLRVQVACAASLNQLGDSGAAQALLSQIAPMLENPDGALREDAVAYLDDLRSPYALPLLTQALRDSNSNVRKDAIDALAHLAIPQSIPLLEQAAADPNPEVARNAVKALERLRNPVPKKPK